MSEKGNVVGEIKKFVENKGEEFETITTALAMECTRIAEAKGLPKVNLETIIAHVQKFVTKDKIKITKINNHNYLFSININSFDHSDNELIVSCFKNFDSVAEIDGVKIAKFILDAKKIAPPTIQKNEEDPTDETIIILRPGYQVLRFADPEKIDFNAVLREFEENESNALAIESIPDFEVLSENEKADKDKAPKREVLFRRKSYKLFTEIAKNPNDWMLKISGNAPIRKEEVERLFVNLKYKGSKSVYKDITGDIFFPLKLVEFNKNNKHQFKIGDNCRLRAVDGKFMKDIFGFTNEDVAASILNSKLKVIRLDKNPFGGVNFYILAFVNQPVDKSSYKFFTVLPDNLLTGENPGIKEQPKVTNLNPEINRAKRIAETSGQVIDFKENRESEEREVLIVFPQLKKMTVEEKKQFIQDFKNRNPKKRVLNSFTGGEISKDYDKIIEAVFDTLSNQNRDVFCSDETIADINGKQVYTLRYISTVKGREVDFTFYVAAEDIEIPAESSEPIINKKYEITSISKSEVDQIFKMEAFYENESIENFKKKVSYADFLSGPWIIKQVEGDNVLALYDGENQTMAKKMLNFSSKCKFLKV